MNVPEAFAVGALLFPTLPTVLLLSLLIAVTLSGAVARWTGGDGGQARGVAEGCAWIGLVGARAWYVAANWSAFRPAPWTALYLWQPGYSPYAGVAIAAVYASWCLGRRPVVERRPGARALVLGYAGGAAVFSATLLAMHLLAPADVLRRGDAVPDFTLATLDGKIARLSDFAGRPVVLNFWATWCPPCRREMPLLESLHAEYGPRGLVVLGIDLEETREVVAAFVATMGVTYPTLVDGPPGDPIYTRTGALHARFGGVGLPTTVFVDRGGRIDDVHVGELNRAILEARAERLLEP